jgi:hypothetical protein
MYNIRICIHKHLGGVFELKSSIISRYSTDSKSTFEE